MCTLCNTLNGADIFGIATGLNFANLLFPFFRSLFSSSKGVGGSGLFSFWLNSFLYLKEASELYII